MFQLPFVIRYDKQTKQQLRAIEAKYHSLIRKVIEKQTWEIRFGPNNRFRVLYGIDHERREVQVQAIGVKKGSRLLVGGEEIEL
jgi:hypothetical protein